MIFSSSFGCPICLQSSFEISVSDAQNAFHQWYFDTIHFDFLDGTNLDIFVIMPNKKRIVGGTAIGFIDIGLFSNKINHWFLYPTHVCEMVRFWQLLQDLPKAGQLLGSCCVLRFGHFLALLWMLAEMLLFPVILFRNWSFRAKETVSLCLFTNCTVCPRCWITNKMSSVIASRFCWTCSKTFNFVRNFVIQQ